MLFLGVASYWTLGHVPFTGDSQLPPTLPTYGYIPRLPKRKHKRAYANWRNRVEFAAIQSTTVISYLQDFFRFSTQIKECLFLRNAVYMHFALFSVWLELFPCCFVPRFAPNPGNATEWLLSEAVKRSWMTMKTYTVWEAVTERKLQTNIGTPSRVPDDCLHATSKHHEYVNKYVVLRFRCA